MRNTHSSIIIDGDFSLFIDGIPNDHECNSKGDIEYYTKSGKVIKWYSIKQWAHLTTEAREPLLYQHFSEIDDPILGASVTCSICKTSAKSHAHNGFNHYV